MAVTVDNASSNLNSGTTNTFALNVSGSDRLLIVCAGTAAAATVTGVTYAGVSMTSVGTVANANKKAWMYALVAPSTGNNNVVITTSGVAQVAGMAVSFNGCSGTTSNFTSNSDNASISVTSAVGDFVVDFFQSQNATSATVGAGQTERCNLDTGNDCGSTEAGAASVTMDWTVTSGTNIAHLGVSVNAGTQGGGLKSLSLLGVGV